MLKILIIFVLGPPPPGGPGGGSGLPFPKDVGGFGPIPARIRGASLFVFFILALSAAGSLADAFPVAVRPKSGPEGRFTARKHYCVM